MTALIEAGVNIKAVQKLTRHSLAALTLDRYARVQGLNLPPLPKPEQPHEMLQATSTENASTFSVTGFVTGNVTVSSAPPFPLCPAMSLARPQTKRPVMPQT